MIIWGFRRKAAVLGHLTMTCRACGATCAHSLRRITRYFTLFFIPVAPLGKKHYAVCASCAKAFQVDDQEAQRMLAHLDATRTQATAQPPAV